MIPDNLHYRAICRCLDGSPGASSLGQARTINPVTMTAPIISCYRNRVAGPWWDAYDIDMAVAMELSICQKRGFVPS